MGDFVVSLIERRGFLREGDLDSWLVGTRIFEGRKVVESRINCFWWSKEGFVFVFVFNLTVQFELIESHKFNWFKSFCPRRL